ncbi:hypothetical protein [Nannocystis pusilla]|uniref:hypothetical protein n=1 Tax=Nannocystis pusilla TaxID=889268 RepID=UPI003B81414F
MTRFTSPRAGTLAPGDRPGLALAEQGLGEQDAGLALDVEAVDLDLGQEVAHAHDDVLLGVAVVQVHVALEVLVEQAALVAPVALAAVVGVAGGDAQQRAERGDPELGAGGPAREAD